MTVCSGCAGGWCAGCVPTQDETLKTFHVRMWDDLSWVLPSEDELVDAHTHVQALEIACHRLRIEWMDWVHIEDQTGQDMQFLDVSVRLDGSLEYDVFPS